MCICIKIICIQYLPIYKKLYLYINCIVSEIKYSLYLNFIHFFFLLSLKNTISLIIDEMGKMSAIAQNLQTAITSANNLKNSDQVLYVMTEHYTPK